MQKRILLQPGFILHTRAYRDSSLILTIFTKEYGIVKLIAKGVRNLKSRQRSQLQCFNLIKVSYLNKTSLGVLTHVEMASISKLFSPNKLVFGLYINELMIKILHEHDPHPSLFDIYYDTLAQISEFEDIERLLRKFEILLLKEVGYGIDFFTDAKFGEKIISDEEYFFDASNGFERKLLPIMNKRCFKGKNILDVGHLNLCNSEILSDAKYILRKVIDQRVGINNINSRKLIIT
ncbi:MAG: DNA repair protein RecO [Legionellales bacterium]|nr:DNA repair protein RecO [Legionellales bacterium]